MLPTHIQQDGGDTRKNCIEPGVLSLHGSPLPVGRNEKKIAPGMSTFQPRVGSSRCAADAQALETMGTSYHS